MEKLCFFNGKIEPLSKVSVDDIGFLRGYGVFEVNTGFRYLVIANDI